PRPDLLADAGFLLPQLRCQRWAEFLGLEHLPNLDLFATVERRALDPLDRLFLRADLQDPEAGDQLFGFRKRPVRHCARWPVELHAYALRRGVEPPAASITPAFASCSLNLPISVRIFSSGITPASLSLLALTITMKRIGGSLWIALSYQLARWLKESL